MMSVGEFKSRFSEALDAVRKGESITVTFGRGKKPVAIVSPVPTKGTKRPLGLLAGKVHIAIADDWEINDSQFLGTGRYHLSLLGSHRDPFDRMLVWQAIQHDLTLVSRDRVMEAYQAAGLKIIW